MADDANPVYFVLVLEALGVILALLDLARGGPWD